MDIRISEELRQNIPQVEGTVGDPDPMVWMKLTATGVGWAGYVIAMLDHIKTEWRDDDTVFYGWVVFWNEELRYFTLGFLEDLPYAVIQDETFVPCPLSEVKAAGGRFQPKFSIGETGVTLGALAAFEATGQTPLLFLRQHILGDWGELSEHDKQANESSLVNGTRLLSAYNLKDGTRIWIVTEANRSATTILLSSEY